MDKFIQVQHITPDLVHVMVKGDRYWHTAAALRRKSDGWEVDFASRFVMDRKHCRRFEQAVEAGMAWAKESDHYRDAVKAAQEAA